MKKDITIGEKYNPAIKITDQAEADRYFDTRYGGNDPPCDWEPAKWDGEEWFILGDEVPIDDVSVIGPPLTLPGE
jgi:hypothetical protein